MATTSCVLLIQLRIEIRRWKADFQEWWASANWLQRCLLAVYGVPIAGSLARLTEVREQWHDDINRAFSYYYQTVDQLFSWLLRPVADLQQLQIEMLADWLIAMAITFRYPVKRLVQLAILGWQVRNETETPLFGSAVCVTFLLILHVVGYALPIFSEPADQLRSTQWRSMMLTVFCGGTLMATTACLVFEPPERKRIAVIEHFAFIGVALSVLLVCSGLSSAAP